MFYMLNPNRTLRPESDAFVSRRELEGGSFYYFGIQPFAVLPVYSTGRPRPATPRVPRLYICIFGFFAGIAVYSGRIQCNAVII